MSTWIFSVHDKPSEFVKYFQINTKIHLTLNLFIALNFVMPVTLPKLGIHRSGGMPEPVASWTRYTETWTAIVRLNSLG